MRMVLLVLLAAHFLFAGTELPEPAAALFAKAEKSKWYEDFAKLKTDIRPSSDKKSFYVVWKSVPEPRRWIVSLHGSRGFATDDLAVWHPHLAGREVGIISLQWWMGFPNEGDAPGSYLTPEQIYREMDFALKELGVKPGTVLFEGFSRGAANSYAVAALDAGKGKRYFHLCVASSGGMSADFPGNKNIVKGEYGDRPLKGTRWVTAAGARDSHPERD
ncbi:MAG: hypothetical protein JNM63_16940, partial [Spirochaetia bacterium]|nr:hypothetical protein [Spirochaetia bacterium]